MSKKHQQNTKVIVTQPKLPFKPEPVGKKKKEEARLALFTAMHTSIRVVDHLGEVINHSHEKDIDRVQLHRTKCTSVIKNVLALHFTQILKEDIKDQPYNKLPIKSCIKPSMKDKNRIKLFKRAKQDGCQ
ncbi:uncharacterized protein LOC114357400 [Ostrinia furnacalis]|uniref:uncharacterized protein LOC114357400 n=1 Tax=Ostrinia furnacalis TaxID=93504 RepID=UPI00103A5B9E|nr:uncharacterized protein LOC114357400 [Ostrinia furnacalis]